ncbi:hypothetical protein [Streptomyces sp. NPDC002537]
MWEYEYNFWVDAPAKCVWDLYAEADSWPLWDVSVERLQLHGRLAEGATGVLTRKGGDPIGIAVTRAVENSELVYEAQLDDLSSVRMIHRLSEVQTGSICLPRGGTKIVHRCEVTGLSTGRFGSFDGPDLAAGIPESVHRLAEMARLRIGKHA